MDGYFAISDSAAVEHARRLASEQGIVAGYTTGANVAAALKLADALASISISPLEPVKP